MQCRNVGSDGRDVQWACHAAPELPDGLKFGFTNVACEGYDYPDDPYVLAGSCGVEYSLHDRRESASKKADTSASSSSWASYIPLLLMLLLLWRCWSPRTMPQRPPPPYSRDPPPPTNPSFPPPYAKINEPTPSPGFWTGLATGGGLGYAAGRMSSSTNAMPTARRTQSPSRDDHVTARSSGASSSTGFGTTRRR
eukprot:Partr_v1_DN25064_c0_g2_i1_m51113 putative transmembrane protein 66